MKFAGLEIGGQGKLPLCYTCGMRSFLFTVIALALSAVANAAGRVELELVTERGVQITAPQEWLQRLTRAGITNVRIRGSRPGDEPRIESVGTDDRPAYVVTGFLSPRNEIVLPGGRFTMSQSQALRDYFDRLAADGPEAITAETGRFGLTEKQFTAAHADLSQKISWDTKDQPLVDLVKQAERATKLRWTIEPSASRLLRSAKPADDEANGITIGTGMALLLRPAGLGVRPTKPRGGEVELQIVAVDAGQETWPIGWKLSKSPHNSFPALFERINVEVDGYTLAEAIDAIAPRIKLPIRWDHATLAEKKIDPAKIDVKLPRTRTYYKRIIDNLLSQGRLGGELRVDEAGTIFYWVTR